MNLSLKVVQVEFENRIHQCNSNRQDQLKKQRTKLSNFYPRLMFNLVMNKNIVMSKIKSPQKRAIYREGSKYKNSMQVHAWSINFQIDADKTSKIRNIQKHRMLKFLNKFKLIVKTRL